MIEKYEIEYTYQGVKFRAFVASPKQGNTRLPCVLVSHDWSGRSDAACAKAVQLAEMGYVGCALDMYGNATVVHTDEDRRALLYPILADRNLVAGRVRAAFDTASQLPNVDSSRVGALGYCFGGLCVLDLARSGADVKGVVSFHGLLSDPKLKRDAKVTSKVLVLHGYEDPLVPPEHVVAFANEMTERGVDWQLHMYGLTKHSFTNPQAHNLQSGMIYDMRADKRSWKSTVDFLHEVLS